VNAHVVRKKDNITEFFHINIYGTRRTALCEWKHWQIQRANTYLLECFIVQLLIRVLGICAIYYISRLYSYFLSISTLRCYDM